MVLILNLSSLPSQHAGEKPPSPVRGLSNRNEDNASAEDVEADTSQEAINVLDLLPRVDIGPQLNGALISELSDKNWKV